MKTPILLFSLLLCVLFVSLSQACSCVGTDSIYSNFAPGGSTRIFHGRAVSRQQRDRDGAELWTFTIAKMYKGSPKADNRVKVLTRPTSCMPSFTVGKVYLVGVYNGEANSCWTVLWSSVPQAARSFLREVSNGNGNFTYDVKCGDSCSNVNWVCGSDGQSYESLCALQQASCPYDAATQETLKYVSTGCCEADRTRTCATLVYQPLCGSDGVTYTDPCAIQRAECKSNSVISWTQGECQSDCDRMCPTVYNPVCGSDGVTYASECQLEIASCQAEKPITIASRGECDAPTCSTICPAVFHPVCGSDGVTYSSECALQTAACQSGKIITIVSEGECQTDDCEIGCTRIYEPVCGSDGVTYSNECELRAAACRSKTTINVASQGECQSDCDRMCPTVYNPVCGSDGVTYANECQLEIASCQAEKPITVTTQGECNVL